MNTISHFLNGTYGVVSSINELLGYIGLFFRSFFMSKTKLTARLVASESQLAVYKLRIKQRKEPKPRFTKSFRLLWVVLSKVWNGWEKHTHLMQPATVKKWHTQVFKVYWRWKSRKSGRPTILQEMKALIRRLSRENPLWSAERIRDTLLLLGYGPPHEDTIRKYMVKPRNPRKKSTTWLPFLRNHLDVSWAMDFFTVVTANFSFIYVFVVLQHGRRKVVHFATTYNPSMEWVIQQLREATPFGQFPRYMFRDNDKIYGFGVPAFLNSCEVEEVRTAYRSPWQNPYVERFVGTVRRELLDHVIIFSEGHLKRLLGEYIEEYYHVARPHQGLDGETPLASKQPRDKGKQGKLISFPVCGGLHHRYERVAA